MATKLGRGVTYHEGVLPIKSHESARSSGKLASLYPHYHNTYGNKTWNDGDLP